jgi:hypothetical protein
MLFKSDEWIYIDEGNANVILGYVGKNRAFQDTAMRIEKDHERHLLHEKWQYKKHIMLSLFGEHHVRLPVRNVINILLK